MLSFQPVLLDCIHHEISMHQMDVLLTDHTREPIHSLVQRSGFSPFSRTDPTATALLGNAFLTYPYTKVMYENVVLQLIFYKKSIYMLRKTYNSANITQNSDVQPGLQTSPHLLREELTRPHQSEDDFQCIRQSPRKYIMFMCKLPRHFRGAYYNRKGSSHPSNCTQLSHSHSPVLESMIENNGLRQLYMAVNSYSLRQENIMLQNYFLFSPFSRSKFSVYQEIENGTKFDNAVNIEIHKSHQYLSPQLL